MLVFDIESDGLLDTITKVHCINALDTETGEEFRYTDHEFYQDLDGKYTDVPCPRTGTVMEGLAHLLRADTIAGHNIIGYDLPALTSVYPDWQYPLSRTCYDSKIASQLLYPNLKDRDFAAIRKSKLPEEFKAKGHIGSHSLFPWGMRLGGPAKQDFNPSQFGHTWATMTFTKEMDEYCMDDVRANAHLIKHFDSKGYSEDALELEMGVAQIITWQERHGIAFDYEAAEELAKVLYARQYELAEECKQVFPPFYVKDGKTFIPKKDNKRFNYTEGAPVTKLKLVDFNPGSRRHIARCLTNKYGWEPTEFTDTGLPKIEEEILAALPFPEAVKISEYLTVQKRLSQLAEGKQAWMKKSKGGRIYGRVNQLGTGTGRMAHHGPNLAQVPGNEPKRFVPYAHYGKECRSLFVADSGRVIVGCDADALELRVLAHFLAKFDGGDYVRTVLEGNKEDGTDMHTRNQLAAGLLKRDTAKTFFYALLYGSGALNLGTIVMSEWDEEKTMRFYAKFPPGNKRRQRIARLGATRKQALTEGIPALGELLKRVGKASQRGHLKGIDGRIIPVRSKHSALNFLCQSAGAIVMKKALVLMFDEFDRQGLDVIPLLNVHDEVQLSTTKEDADAVGRIAADAIRQAGEYYRFRCPLAGDYEVGTNWSETH